MTTGEMLARIDEGVRQLEAEGFLETAAALTAARTVVESRLGSVVCPTCETVIFDAFDPWPPTRVPVRESQPSRPPKPPMDPRRA